METEVATPVRRLEAMQEGEARRDAELRCRITRAALEASGELGYRKLTVQEVLDRSGGSRAHFYRLFANKNDCYAAGYEVAIERLSEELLGVAAAEPGWSQGFRTALGELARFVSEQPVLARGLLVEVHVAGGAAIAKRKEVIERLSRAIDSARRENESRHSPPPITAAFMVSAIEESVVGALSREAPEEFAASVPDLTYLAAMFYFGDEAARAQLDGAG